MNPSKRRKCYEIIDQTIGSSDDVQPTADRSADLDVEIAGQILSKGIHFGIYRIHTCIHTYSRKVIYTDIHICATLVMRHHTYFNDILYLLRSLGDFIHAFTSSYMPTTVAHGGDDISEGSYSQDQEDSSVRQTTCSGRITLYASHNIYISFTYMHMYIF